MFVSNAFERRRKRENAFVRFEIICQETKICPKWPLVVLVVNATDDKPPNALPLKFDSFFIKTTQTSEKIRFHFIGGHDEHIIMQKL
jgi:hypothetical protein